MGQSPFLLMVNSAPLVPYWRAPAVRLKADVTVVEVLNTKVWFRLRAGSEGQVVLRGLQVVKVWAWMRGRRARAPRRKMGSCIVVKESDIRKC